MLTFLLWFAVYLLAELASLARTELDLAWHLFGRLSKLDLARLTSPIFMGERAALLQIRWEVYIAFLGVLARLRSLLCLARFVCVTWFAYIGQTAVCSVARGGRFARMIELGTWLDLHGPLHRDSRLTRFLTSLANFTFSI